MKRIVALWLTLLVPALIGTVGTPIAWSRTIDLRFEAILSILVVPIVQAIAIASQRRVEGGGSIGAAARALAHPLVRPVLLLDALLVGAGFVTTRISLAGPSPLQKAWIASKLFAATAAFVLVAAGRARAATMHRTAPVAILAASLAAVGMAAYVPWLSNWPSLVMRGPLGNQALLWRTVESYGALLVAASLIVLWSESALAARAPEAAAALDAALALMLTGALIVTLNFYFRPFLSPPWDRVAPAAASLAATCVLAAALNAWSPNRP